jgi:hypothetical protein
VVDRFLAGCENAPPVGRVVLEAMADWPWLRKWPPEQIVAAMTRCQAFRVRALDFNLRRGTVTRDPPALRIQTQPRGDCQDCDGAGRTIDGRRFAVACPACKGTRYRQLVDV